MHFGLDPNAHVPPQSTSRPQLADQVLSAVARPSRKFKHGPGRSRSLDRPIAETLTVLAETKLLKPVHDRLHRRISRLSWQVERLPGVCVRQGQCGHALPATSEFGLLRLCTGRDLAGLCNFGSRQVDRCQGTAAPAGGTAYATSAQV